jgi:hypothetical protein
VVRDPPFKKPPILAGGAHGLCALLRGMSSSQSSPARIMVDDHVPDPSIKPAYHKRMFVFRASPANGDVHEVVYGRNLMMDR